MGNIGINIKRMVITLILGLLAGIICAGGTVMGNNPNFQITIEYLIYLVYNRIILGLVIGLAENVKIIKHELANSIIRGALLGAIVSTILVIIPGLVAFSFVIAGIVFGIFIDLIATILAPSEE
jgi:hypothetical protein